MVFRSAAVHVGIFAFLCAFASGLVVTAPPEFANTHLNTPRVMRKVYPFVPVSGRAIESEYPANCSEVNGTIVVMTTATHPHLPLQDIAVQLQNCGALAVILRDIISPYAGSATGDRNENSSLVRIPMLSMGKTDTALFESMLHRATQNQTYLVVDLRESENDINYWELWADTYVGYVLQAIGSALFAVNSVLALTKLIAFARNSHFSLLNVPQAILTIRFVSNLFRLAVWATDPMFLGRFYSIITAQLFFSFSFPFEIIGTLITAFYWHKILRTKQTFTYNFIAKLKFPIIFVSFLLVSVEVGASAMRVWKIIVAASNVITAAIYFVVILITGLYFLLVGFLVISRLRASAEANTSSAQLVRHVVVSVVATGVLLLLWALLIPGYLLNAFSEDPFFFRSLLFVQSMLIGIHSLVSILSIRAPFSPTSDSLGAQKAIHSSVMDMSIMDSMVHNSRALDDASRHVKFQTYSSGTTTANDSVATTVIYD